MTAPNHIAGGIAITGIIASLLDINILEDKTLIAVVVIASLLPDIDHTRSIIGKAFYPFARFLQRHYGHRTITHSLAAWVTLTLVVSTIEHLALPHSNITLAFSIGYLVHLLMDATTKQGVPLFYPFKRNPFVLPGNPELRFDTANPRQEFFAFTFFIVMGVFTQPLMEKGFWTSYNTLFGTLKHLQSEFHRSSDLIHITFNIQEGSTTNDREGLCVAVDEDHMIVLTRKKQFRTYPQEGQILSDIIPNHTAMNFTFVNDNFQMITLDSLQRLFGQAKYTNLNIQATIPFQLESEGMTSNHTTLQLEYPNNLVIRPLSPKPKDKWIPSQKAQIKTREVRLLQKQYNDDLLIYNTQLTEYQQLTQRISTTTDLVEKQILMEKHTSLKPPTPPKSINPQLEKLQLQLKNINATEYNRYQNHLNQDTPGPLLFSGTYTKLQINGKDI